MDDTIDVIPNLKTKKFTSTSFKNIISDPDVDTINKKTEFDEINVLNMKSEQTAEELNSKINDKPAAGYNYMLIGLVILIIILVIVVLYYMTKPSVSEEHKPINPTVVKPGVTKPVNSTSETNVKSSKQCPTAKSVNLPSVPNNVPVKQRPTKSELESTLRKLENIAEEPVAKIKEKIKERKKKVSKHISQVEKIAQIENITPIEKSNKSDDIISNTFYDNIQDGLDIDEAEDNEDNEFSSESNEFEDSGDDGDNGDDGDIIIDNSDNIVKP